MGACAAPRGSAVCVRTLKQRPGEAGRGRGSAAVHHSAGQQPRQQGEGGWGSAARGHAGREGAERRAGRPWSRGVVPQEQRRLTFAQQLLPHRQHGCQQVLARVVHLRSSSVGGAIGDCQAAGPCLRFGRLNSTRPPTLLHAQWLSMTEEAAPRLLATCAQASSSLPHLPPFLPPHPRGAVGPRPWQLAARVGVQRLLHLRQVEVSLHLVVDAGVVNGGWPACVGRRGARARGRSRCGARAVA